MTHIFNLNNNNNNTSDKISIDDLYEKKHQKDLKNLELFNKVLHRVHTKIKMTSRQKIDNQICFFVVPEIIMGVSSFDQGTCIAFLIDKLKENKFNVRYIHPNTLLIGWSHYIPHYIRDEIKKKTGQQIDEFGNKINSTNNKEVSFNNQHNNSNNMDNLVLNIASNNNNSNNSNNNNSNNNNNTISLNTQEKFKPITSYKPTGNFIYNDDIIDKTF
jgi:hypothetical protein